MRVEAATIVEGLYEWLKANAWFLEDQVDGADLTAELAAQYGLLMLCSGELRAYRALPKGVRSLVVRMFLAYMAQMMGPRKRAVAELTLPPGASLTPVQLAWLAVEQEVRQSMPPDGRPQ